MSNENEIFGRLMQNAAGMPDEAPPPGRIPPGTIPMGPGATQPPGSNAPPAPQQQYQAYAPGPAPSNAFAANRPVVKWTLPKACVAMWWHRPDSDLYFGLVQLHPNEHAHAVQIGSGNADAIGTELVLQSVVMIGGRSSPLREDLLDWWDQIGPKGRDLVRSAWLDIHQPSKEERETFLASRSV